MRPGDGPMTTTIPQPEEWAPIRRTKGLYSVSTWGRIRRNAGIIIVEKPVRERILKPKGGWVSLSVNGTITSENIDELMHETFGRGAS
jgi:NUMOD4 motif